MLALVLGNSGLGQPAEINTAGRTGLIDGQVEHTQETSVQGSGEGGSYELDFGVRQDIDPQSHETSSMTYNCDLKINGNTVMSVWINGERGSSTDPASPQVIWGELAAVSPDGLGNSPSSPISVQPTVQSGSQTTITPGGSPLDDADGVSMFFGPAANDGYEPYWCYGPCLATAPETSANTPA